MNDGSQIEQAMPVPPEGGLPTNENADESVQPITASAPESSSGYAGMNQTNIPEPNAHDGSAGITFGTTALDSQIVQNTEVDTTKVPESKYGLTDNSPTNRQSTGIGLTPRTGISEHIDDDRSIIQQIGDRLSKLFNRGQKLDQSATVPDQPASSSESAGNS